MKKVFVFAALLVAAAVSCTVEIAPVEKPIAPKVGYVEISLNASLSDTKATLDGKTVVWEVGEKVAVFTSASDEAEEFTVESVNGSSVTISGSVPEAATSFIAAFPYANAVSCTENVVKMKVAYSQELSGEQVVDPSALASVAYFETAASTPVFQNAVALASFSVGLEGVTEVNLSTVTSGKLSGEVNVTVSAETDPAVGAAEYNTLTVSKADGFTQGVTYYAAIAPCSIEGFSVRLTKEGKRSTRTSTSSATVGRNQVLTLGEQNGGEVWKYGTISNAAQLKEFLSEASTYAKSDVVGLGCDIDCSGVEIGQAASFAGQLAGNNFTISNWATSAPMFASLSGMLFNVNIDKTCSYNVPTGGNVGYLVGHMEAGSYVSGCINNADINVSEAITAAYKMGGLVGCLDKGFLFGCVNNGDIIIDVPSSAGNHCIGGVVGSFDSGEASIPYIEECTNNGKVSFNVTAKPAFTYMGGVVGASPIKKASAAQNAGKVLNCVNTGDVYYKLGTPGSGTYVNIGGVAGYLEADIEGCSNSGNVTIANEETAANCTRPAIGGVAACVLFSAKDCSNTGDVHLNGTFAAGTGDAAGAGGSHQVLAGGVFGLVGGTAANKALSIINCTNEGTLSTSCRQKSGGGTQTYIGGVVGYSSVVITGCSNKGTMSIQSSQKNCRIGGIVGQMWTDISDCSNSGAITVDGRAEISNSTNCFGYQNYVGGIIGHMGATLNLCNLSNSGKVSFVNSYVSGVLNYAGGIIGGYEASGTTFLAAGLENDGEVFVDTQSSVCVGGLAGGYGGKDSYITSSANNGNVRVDAVGAPSGKESEIGGLIGYANVYLVGCANNGSIINNGDSASSTGGFVGGYGEATKSFSDCTANGPVTGPNAGSVMGWFRKTGTNTLTLGLENACFYVNPSATVNGNEPGLVNVAGNLKGNSIADTYLIFGENHVPFSESLDQKLFVYAGKKYPIVKLDDDRWWMAAPLAYVPAGKTVSSNPVEDAGIWYTYDTDDTNVTPRTDFTDGYLYDYPTAFGVAQDDITYGTKAQYQAGEVIGNYRDFEGTQGICPPGWYIPTRSDFLKLVGASNKDDSLPQNPETAAVSDPTAVYWVPAYSGSSIPVFNEAGWNFSFLGVRAKTSTAQTGAYNKKATNNSTCLFGEWIPKPALNQIMCSTPYMPNAAGNTVQYFCMMSTFTAAYPEGRLSLSYASYVNGVEVRCIRQAAAVE